MIGVYDNRPFLDALKVLFRQFAFSCHGVQYADATQFAIIRPNGPREMAIGALQHFIGVALAAIEDPASVGPLPYLNDYAAATTANEVTINDHDRLLEIGR
ncbi:hypothetical protein M1432_02330 [Patescibacteria group bacterium]|nr:hypothetical protein [Patescibacteria group bacterium]